MNLYRLSLILIISTLTCTVNAQTVQWSKGYTAGCIDATQREDGTALAQAEIQKVVYQIVSGTSVIYEAIMTGGCKDTYIDTKQFIPPGEYLLHGFTVDTAGLQSALSSPGVALTVQKARPKPPSGLR
jgi:hypothetical protein